MNINLPRDILYEILLHTEPKTLISSCATNKSIANICNDENFWTNKIQVDFELISNYWRSDTLTKLLPNGSILIQNKPRSISFKRFYFDLLNDHLRPIVVTSTLDQLDLPSFIWVRDIDSINSIIAQLNLDQSLILMLLNLGRMFYFDTVAHIDDNERLNSISANNSTFWNLLTEIEITDTVNIHIPRNFFHLNHLLNTARVRMTYS